MSQNQALYKLKLDKAHGISSRTRLPQAVISCCDSIVHNNDSVLIASSLTILYSRGPRAYDGEQAKRAFLHFHLIVDCSYSTDGTAGKHETAYEYKPAFGREMISAMAGHVLSTGPI